MPSFGNASVTLLAFIVCLSIIVFVHEFGHYYIGKISGIKAEVFSVGFGPVLISRVDKHGTVWQIAAFPFGGYVKFKGDKGAASDPDVDRLNAMDRNDLRDTMHGAPLWARAATVAAGPAFNFVFSALVFVGLFMYQGLTKVPLTIGTVYDFPYASDIRTGDKIVSVDGVPAPEGEDFEQFFNAIRASKSFPLVDYVVERDGSVMFVQGPSMDTARINQLVPRSAAIEAGLAVGDVITQVNGEDIFSFQDLKTRVEGSNGAALNLTVWRKRDVFTTKLVPKRVDEQADDGTFTTYWRIGIVGSLYSFEPMTETVPLGRSIWASLKATYAIMEGSVTGLYHVVSGAASSCNISGPIGIAETSGQMARQGGEDLIWFIAVLSTAVGIVNLFPIPVLDGGHLVFYAYEAVFRRPPNTTVVNRLMTVGLAIILSFMMFAIYNDIFCP
jgi:regulator of sigma E protease